MNIKLFQELAHIIDKDIVVCIGELTEADIFNKIIYLSNERDIEHYLIDYMTLDLGYNYLDYCSRVVYYFLHELGHIVNGWIDIDGYSLVVTTLKGNSDSLAMNLYRYIRLDDEVYANEWAYDFIKSNRSYIKRLTKEIRNV